MICIKTPTMSIKRIDLKNSKSISILSFFLAVWWKIVPKITSSFKGFLQIVENKICTPFFEGDKCHLTGFFKIISPDK